LHWIIRKKERNLFTEKFSSELIEK